MSWIKKLFTDLETVIDAAFLNGLQDQIIADEATLADKVDKATGKGLSTNDYTTAEKQKLDGIESGAQKNPDLSHYVTDASYNPTFKTSGMTQSVGVDSNGKLWTTPGSGGGSGGVSDYESLTSKPSIEGITLSGEMVASDFGLAKLSDIPAAVTEQTVSGWGFTKNTGTYSKPSGGIPKTDLASAVQTSLDKADTALQAVPSTYRTASDQDTIDAAKLNTNQGAANEGKYMVVGADGNLTPATPGSLSLPSVIVDNTSGTADTFFEKSYTVSGNGVVVVFAGIFSDSTDGYGTWIAEIYYNDNLIMAEGSRLNSPDKTSRPFGASTSAPIEVTNGSTLKISLQNTKSGTKTIYRRLLCFGCTATAT